MILSDIADSNMSRKQARNQQFILIILGHIRYGNRRATSLIPIIRVDNLDLLSSAVELLFGSVVGDFPDFYG